MQDRWHEWHIQETRPSPLHHTLYVNVQQDRLPHTLNLWDNTLHVSRRAGMIAYFEIEGLRQHNLEDLLNVD